MPTPRSVLSLSRPALRLASAAALLLGAIACAKGTTSNNTTPPGTSAGAAGDGGEGGDGGEAGQAGAAGASGQAGGSTACVCGEPGCGDCPAVATIIVGNFRIDSIEVTNAAYAAWLATKPSPADPEVQPAACAENTSFSPAAPWPATGEEERPVTGVDWCDAAAYCQWAGKRLCGKIGGGSLDASAYKDAAKSQWYKACSNGAQAYPYGAAYEAKKCNGAEFGAGEKLPAGETADCVGAASGLYNLSGNVWEWEDACNASGDCRIRGGSFANLGDKLSCDVDSALPRSTTDAKVGFRCCK